jgi:hypothetical protein
MKRSICATILGALFALGAMAATPRDTLVVAKNIEDMVSLDPAEAFEFSSGETISNIYETLVRCDAQDPSKIQPAWPPRGSTGGGRGSSRRSILSVCSQGLIVRSRWQPSGEPRKMVKTRSHHLISRDRL